MTNSKKNLKSFGEYNKDILTVSKPVHLNELVKDLKSQIQKKYSLNPMNVPSISHISITTTPGLVSMGDKSYVALLTEYFTAIVMQKPYLIKARKSVASFKLKEGQNLGYGATLRGARAYDFLTRFVYTVLPRIKDFKGFSSNSFDSQFNFNIGIKDSGCFYEVDLIKISRPFGMNISIHLNNVSSKEQAMDLLRGLFLPIW